MKQITLYLVSLLFWTAAYANRGPVPTPAPAGSAATASKAVAKVGAVRFQFKNVVSDQQDSILVIFDRYDHTGAGVVYQLFATDAEHGITIPAIPAGKYYVTIECRGVHRDHMETLVTIKSKKSEKVQLKLRESEVFSKDNVVIPAYHPSFADMTILKSGK
ncbi:hypothetical protein [Puia dinghuensis]|uniref:Rhamnogalacturonan lyase domain-containing protein n=1 Tax=Puia dinghuensis TaxID=1792502 RepID=A0A8J2XQJ0_9BACT|nr:hypothetical protein [Puia dinghuensis]GGA85214.1 hypothetical protein GCM10011511_05300 [Puia dinghuensis]